MLCNEAYASLASGVTHGALWSAERPAPASLAAAGDTPRQGDFHPDQRLPEADQAQLADYRRSGFDRGHMTPSGDMPTDTAQEQSFSLANIVPQQAKLNRGVWERIEKAVRDLASREGELYVVTGAAFQVEHLQAIGPDGVLVPSSVWTLDKALKRNDRHDGGGVVERGHIAKPSRPGRPRRPVALPGFAGTRERHRRIIRRGLQGTAFARRRSAQPSGYTRLRPCSCSREPGDDAG